MSKPHEILEFSPQELSLLEQILKSEVEQHPETADIVQPLLDKVTAHFATVWPYDYKISQEEMAFLKQAMDQAFKNVEERMKKDKGSDSPA
jgi:hypothetical protein